MAVAKPERVQNGWNEWVQSRPACIQELCGRFPPDRLYRLKDSGDRCTIYSYNEAGTMTVEITGEYNRCLFERNVFGIAPSNLVECDLPGPDEELGCMAAEAGMTEKEVNEVLIPIIREEMRAKKIGGFAPKKPHYGQSINGRY
jgi:hypothetical protein